MRAILAAALAVLTTPSPAKDVSWLLEPGLYCPLGADVLPILVGPGRGMVGIDGLDCAAVRLEGGRIRSEACYANGGSSVGLDTDLVVTPSGSLLHDGVLYRRRAAAAPCPGG